MRAKNAEVVPAGPFADWLNARVEYWQSVTPRTPDSMLAGPIGRLCAELGWPVTDGSARRLHRMRHRVSETAKGRKSRHGVSGIRIVGVAEHFTRSTVEDALFHAGVDFSELYPEIAAAEELLLEPEGWCPNCREHRNPINGVCPFCEWRIGPKTGQVLLGRRLGRAA